MGDKDSNIHVRINTEDWEAFKEEADKKGLSASVVIRSFVRKFKDNPNILSELF